MSDQTPSGRARPEAIQAVPVRHPGRWVTIAVLANDSDPVHKLQALANDPDPVHRLQAVANDPDPVHRLQAVTNDPDPVHRLMVHP